jgi:peptidoglycan biosynthesis protein MviN/MurJ (putative lipid II flippase)
LTGFSLRYELVSPFQAGDAAGAFWAGDRVKWFAAFRARVRNAHPDHHAIARGMVWVALFVFVGKLAGAAKEMVVAYRYGVSAEVDAYLFVLNLVSWPVGVWFSVLTVVLVPLAARIRNDAAGELPRFRAELLGLALLLGLGLTLVLGLAVWGLLQTGWTGLPLATVTIAAGITPWLAGLVPLGVLISLFSAWTLAAGHHVNTLLEGVPALVLVLALLVLPVGGVEPLVWGTLAGFAFHLAGLAWPLARHGEMDAPRWHRQSPHWPGFWQGFGVMLAGQTLMSFTGIIDQFFAAHLDAGSIATLSYANRILALVLGLGATAVGRATLPVFSQAQALGGDQGRQVAMHWVRWMLLLGVITLVVGWWLAPWAVKVLFERGAFTAQDTQAVTSVLRYGLVQVPFYFAGLVLVSLLASQGKYREIAVIATTNLVVKGLANLTFIPWLGINGIVLATALMSLTSMVLCWFSVIQRQVE